MEDIQKEKERKNIRKDKETDWTSLEVTWHWLLLKWATKTRKSNIYSAFPIWFLIHILQITLDDERGKATLYKNIPANNKGKDN